MKLTYIIFKFAYYIYPYLCVLIGYIFSLLLILQENTYIIGWFVLCIIHFLASIYIIVNGIFNNYYNNIFYFIIQISYIFILISLILICYVLYLYSGSIFKNQSLEQPKKDTVLFNVEYLKKYIFSEFILMYVLTMYFFAYKSLMVPHLFPFYLFQAGVIKWISLKEYYSLTGYILPYLMFATCFTSVFLSSYSMVLMIYNVM